MAIQWFPGHMHATKKAILERMKGGIDVVVELLDARLPGSSSNPLLAQLTQGKPALKLLNKQDLADPARTDQWLDHYNSLPATRALALDASIAAPAQRLIAACRELAPLRGGLAKPVRVLVCGIPNVGKSTLINSLAGKRAAKTGDEPGITKLEQKIALASDFYLFDTPGMLWPKIIVEPSGYNLAASGAVGRNAYDEEEVALELLAYLKAEYPDRLAERYKLEEVGQRSDEELLSAIGRTRGAVLPGGRVSLHKAGEIVLNDFRNSSLGRITLETPAQYAQWLAEGERLEAERQQKKRSRGRRADEVQGGSGTAS
ncbi:ribosome biogenesis GTPase YlqF [Aquabacterium sp. A7-Y]|uniref:ribosome biogenesis GTPase YlqF n=1 Tax=Aquabacterium sp. A7-Y TaxID=1349605 RepID=UPI00223E3B40|nr:ribosome biogenesis GTPase YlqF [Aquabacterium sp. A7-Y]MCW7539721.1 ribosome biogenesis GTPase YlqF [Aquabacterium sp. A7-Y]